MAQQLDLAGNEWTFDLLRDIDTQLHDIAANKFKLDTFPNQIEVISAEQMLDAYSSGALELRQIFFCQRTSLRDGTTEPGL
jgi:spore cortex formation protein SpoVR/YcgB (stage V sporulation)